MALSLILGEAGLTAERMETRADVRWRRSRRLLHHGRPPDLEGQDSRRGRAKFEELAGKAKAGCPVSKLLKAAITMDATLES